jgi:hypothetical protein
MYLLLRILILPFILTILIVIQLYKAFEGAFKILLYGGELLINEKEDKVYISSIYKELKNQYKSKENDKEINK